MDSLDNTWPDEFGLPYSITFKAGDQELIRIGELPQQATSGMAHPLEGKVSWLMTFYWASVFHGFFHAHMGRGARGTMIDLNLDGVERTYLMKFPNGVKMDYDPGHNAVYISGDFFMQVIS